MQTGGTSDSADATSRIADSTIVSRSPSVLTAEIDGEVVMMSIEQGQYFGLDDIGSDIWKRIEPPCAFADLIEPLSPPIMTPTAPRSRRTSERCSKPWRRGTR